ncbi:GNAT family N-acetyltransferase [Kribbella sp. NPDC004536]|uniref:GNAT family N-acetyltransferase n=1 Tax=Kribbella sp. NPDC004536 TaxID=3364106 RepID=UPI00369E5828
MAISLPDGMDVRALGVGDAEALAALLAAKELVDQEGEHYSAEDLAHELADPTLESLGIWSGDQLIGFGAIHTSTTITDVHRMKTEGTIHPDWRGRGIGKALMLWLIARAGELHAAKHPGAPAEIVNTTIGTNLGVGRLLRKLGFQETRYHFDMERGLDVDVPEALLEVGLEMVPYDESLDEALRETHNLASADIWGATSKDADAWKSDVTGLGAFRGGSSYLVLDGQTVASYVLGYEWDADTAATGIRELYIGQLGTRQTHRGRGLARAALSKVLTAAATDGYQRARLGVDGDGTTGALQLYEGLGFMVRSKWITYGIRL